MTRDTESGRETGGREEGIEVCPVTIAQPSSNSEELLAMQIDTQGGGNNLDWKKKTLKRHFPTFSHKRRSTAYEAEMEINSSEDFTVPSVPLTHSSLVSFTAPSLKLTKNGEGGD